MKLTFDQIKAILHGAVRTEEKDGKLLALVSPMAVNPKRLPLGSLMKMVTI